MQQLSRRTFMASMASALSAGAVAGTATGAQGAEPFPVNLNEWKKLEYKWQRRDMEYQTSEPAGTIIVDPSKRFLYLVHGNGMATRYGVAVGKSTMAWEGEVIVKKMREWPVWVPAPYHIQHKPDLAKWLPQGMPGGLTNPMGARAMYLFKGEVDTINRIHGSAKLEEIGKKATAGCIGMLNADVIDLYSKVQVGTRVLMLG